MTEIIRQVRNWQMIENRYFGIVRYQNEQVPIFETPWFTGGDAEEEKENALNLSDSEFIFHCQQLTIDCESPLPF